MTENQINNRINNPNYIPYPHSIIDTKDGNYRKWTKWRRKLKYSLYERSKIWVEITKDYALVCGICKLPLNYTESTIDHIVPLYKGGNSFITNLQLTHYLCNVRKDARKSPKLNKNEICNE